MAIIKAGFSALALLSISVAAAGLSGCGGGAAEAGDATSPPPGALSAVAELGDQLFGDTKLSASGRQACATCHVPSNAYAATDALSAPLGGRNVTLPGLRNAPSLRYASYTPPFSIAAGSATGGFFRDGRASSLAAQAAQPFVTSFEMANQDAAEVISRLHASPASLAQFVAVYGESALDDPDVALKDMAAAIAAYETEDPSFHPFSSKFDFWLAGQTQLTSLEQQGLALFNDPTRGNCTACHPSQRQGYNEHALFTDFTYDNIGVPRNWKIAANLAHPLSPVNGAPLTYIPVESNIPADSEYTYYDGGLCGPLAPASNDPHPRPVFSDTTTLCGQFKVPTLRNIALTAPYFHNGVFDTLKQVIEWYVTRDINNNVGNNPNPVAAGPGGNPYVLAGSFYLAADGSPDQFEYNDLPVEFDANVNVGEVPYTPPTFSGGQAPTLTVDDINAVIAFLCTLTDGYDPDHPDAYALPEQCQAAVAASPKSLRAE